MEDELPFEYLDTLNMLRYHGGLNRLDLYVMSISASIIHDLVDEGLCRSGILNWTITRRGRQILEDADITSFWDTRK